MTNDPDVLMKDFYSRKSLQLLLKGKTIILPDEVNLPPITYIERGIIEQYDITPEGEKVVLNIFKPGSFFPAASAVNHSLNSHYFEAATDVAIRQAKAAEVEALLIAHPILTYELLKRLYRGLDGLLQKLSSSLALPARQRLLNELTVHGQRFGAPQPDQSVLIVVTALQLAHQTGLARETVSRELKKLEVQGMVSLQRGKIILRHHAPDSGSFR